MLHKNHTIFSFQKFRIVHLRVGYTGNSFSPIKFFIQFFVNVVLGARLTMEKAWLVDNTNERSKSTFNRIPSTGS